MKKVYSLFLLFFVAVVLIGCEGKGTLEIDNPKNAKVYINGKEVGTTPFKTTLKEDKYTITVATSPFDLETKKDVQIYYDHTTKLDFKPTKKGLLVVNSKPQGAKVIEKNEVIGKTPLKIKLDIGKHKIIFVHGDVGTSRTVYLEYGKTTELFVNLEKAVLHLTADPSDAKLIVDGKEIGSFPTTVELDEGVHKLTVSRPPYVDTFTLKVKKGDEFRIQYVLREVQLPPVQAYGPITFTPNKKYLVTMGKAGIYFWDIKKFKPQISLYDPKDIRNFDKFINFGISSDGKYVVGIKPIRKMAYALKDKEKKHDKILVWDMRTTSPVLSKLYVMESKAVGFNKDSSKIYFITKDGVIKIADRKTGNIQGEIPFNDSYGFAKFGNGKIYIGTGSGKLVIFDTNQDKIVDTIPVANGKINDVELSQDKKYLVVASSDKSVKILDTQTNKVIGEFNFDNPILAVNLSPQNDKLAISKANNVVEVYDKDKKQMLYKIDNFQNPVISLAFANDEILITASSIKTPVVKIWKNGHLLKKWIQTIE